MIEATKQLTALAKQKLKRFAIRTSIAGNVLAVAVVLLLALATNKGWVVAQFIPPAIAIGGPAEMKLSAANQEAAQASRPAPRHVAQVTDSNPLPSPNPTVPVR
jgi:hypothetical protein